MIKAIFFVLFSSCLIPLAQSADPLGDFLGDKIAERGQTEKEQAQDYLITLMSPQSTVDAEAKVYVLAKLLRDQERADLLIESSKHWLLAKTKEKDSLQDEATREFVLKQLTDLSMALTLFPEEINRNHLRRLGDVLATVVYRIQLRYRQTLVPDQARYLDEVFWQSLDFFRRMAALFPQVYIDMTNRNVHPTFAPHLVVPLEFLSRILDIEPFEYDLYNTNEATLRAFLRPISSDQLTRDFLNARFADEQRLQQMKDVLVKTKIPTRLKIR